MEALVSPVMTFVNIKPADNVIGGFLLDSFEEKAKGDSSCAGQISVALLLRPL